MYVGFFYLPLRSISRALVVVAAAEIAVAAISLLTFYIHTRDMTIIF